MTDRLDILSLRRRAAAELRRRNVGTRPGLYADAPGGDAALYGSTAAANIHAVLGISLGERETRRAWAETILGWQRADGTFGERDPGHALCMVLIALNLLGEEPPANLAPLAPTDTAVLADFLAAHDWSSTHKELYGRMAPLLASGAVPAEWTDILVDRLAARLDATRPRATWCADDDPPWKVISCIYHVCEVFDAACIPYPKPRLLLQRLLDLDWPACRRARRRTLCTDGDWAWLLAQLTRQLPRRYPEAMAQIRDVAAQRVADWQAGAIDFASLSTHHIYCYLWVTACFQQLSREHFRGPPLHDTLNDPSLLQLGGLPG